MNTIPSFFAEICEERQQHNYSVQCFKKESGEDFLKMPKESIAQRVAMRDVEDEVFLPPATSSRSKKSSSFCSASGSPFASRIVQDHLDHDKIADWTGEEKAGSTMSLRRTRSFMRPSSVQRMFNAGMFRTSSRTFSERRISQDSYMVGRYASTLK